MNQLGKIPSLTYGDTPLVESEVITEFLADTFPSHLLPAPSDPAQVKIFMDLFHKFIVPPLFRVLQKPLSAEQLDAVGDKIVAAVDNHIFPKILETPQGPFFGGRWQNTLAEVMVAGFVKRIHLYSDNGILPKSVNERLGANQRYDHWSLVVRNLEAVRNTWFEEEAKMLVANVP